MPESIVLDSFPLGAPRWGRRATHITSALLAFLLLVPLLQVVPLSHAESLAPGKLQILVALVDIELSVRPVPKYRLELEHVDTGRVFRGTTDFEGKLILELPGGVYRVNSVEPVQFEGNAYAWKLEVTVVSDELRELELSNDNAGVGSESSKKPADRTSTRDRPDRISVGLGGGVVGNRADADGAGDVDGSGGFITVQVFFPNDWFLKYSGSATEDDEAGLVEDELLRGELSAGFVFRREYVVRPFVHGGFASVSVEETFIGVRVIDDSSQTVTFGAGLMAGNTHHNFYLDVAWDFDHEVTDRFGANLEFDLTEVHLGYLYRF